MSHFHEIKLAGSHSKGRLFLNSMPARFEPLSEFAAAIEAEDVYCIK